MSCKSDIEELIDTYEHVLYELVEAKHMLAELKGAVAVETAKINSKTKEEWKAIGATNEQGRNAYITLELEDINVEVNDLTRKVRIKEVHVKVLERKINYLMECFRQEGAVSN